MDTIIKTCPLCAATFTCTPKDCWCSELPTVMPMIEGADCYCPACLKAIIEEKVESTKWSGVILKNDFKELK